MKPCIRCWKECEMVRSRVMETLEPGVQQVITMGRQAGVNHIFRVGGSLNDQVHVFDAWSPVNGTAWEQLEGVVLLDEVCYQWVGFEVSKSQAKLSFPLSLPEICESVVNSQLLLQCHGCLPPPCFLC